MIFRSTSKRPILIAGNGVRSAGASNELIKFAKKTDIPILTTMNSVDLIQDDLRIGFIGVYGNRIANMIVKNSDLVIAVGARLGLRQIGNIKEYFAPNAALIRADIDEYELSRSVKINEEKHLIDAKDFLSELLLENIPLYTEWKHNCLLARDILAEYDREEGNKCIEKISELLPRNPIIAVDVGQNLCWSAQSLSLKGQMGRILIGGSYGSMGCALPYAIGASIANKRDIVYCITGDGGLQMNIQELECVKREWLPIKIIVLNNHVLGKISEIQRNSYKAQYAQTTEESGYTVPDFKKVADAYGIKSVRLNSYVELNDYSDWLLDDDPCLIDIKLSKNSILIPKVNWNSDSIKPELDEEITSRIEEILCQ